MSLMRFNLFACVSWNFTPEILWASLHGFLSIGFVAWWQVRLLSKPIASLVLTYWYYHGQTTLKYAKSAKNFKMT